MDGTGGTRQPALEHGARKSGARPPLSGLLGEKLVDVGRDRLIECVLLAIEAKADRMRMPVREQAVPRSS